MTNEEFNKLCEALRAQGFDDKDLLETILQMWKDGKIDIEELGKLAGALGYELSEEFLAEQEPKQEKAEGAPEEISEEEVEDATEVEGGEEESEDEEESTVEEDEETSEEEDEEDESEEDKKKKARKLFDLD